MWNTKSKNELLSLTSGIWKAKYSHRYCVQVKRPNGMPLIDAKVVLKTMEGGVLWEAMTDNTGKAELWSNKAPNGNGLKIKVTRNETSQTIDNVMPFSKGINFVTLDVPCSVPDQLDVAFLVDATGSMGDEINYLKFDLDSVIQKVSAEYKHLNLRMASVFYRDKSDEYLTKKSEFSSNTDLTRAFIQAQQAGGGGDYPEAVDAGLDVAINQLNWSLSARARILFVLLDAPPHTEGTPEKLAKLTQEAAKKGIRIVPVACSGANKTVENIMRILALNTNGNYTFLTNHSGVGGNHIEPSTDKYKVESFREVLVRVCRQFSITPDCQNFIDPVQLVSIDTTRKIQNPFGSKDTLYANKTLDSAKLAQEKELTAFLAYPNPTGGKVNLKYSSNVKAIYLADLNGKILQEIKVGNEGLGILDLGIYAHGVYLIQYYNGLRWRSEKIIYTGT